MDNLEAIKIMQSIQAMLVSPQEEDKRVILAIQKGIEALQMRDVPDKKVGKWISVKDRLPTESDGTVLICYPNEAPYNLMEPYVKARHNSRVATGHYSQHSHTWYHGDFHAVGGADPIAWMPLPEPPKDGTT